MFKAYIEHSNMEAFIKVPKFYLRLTACWPLGKSKFPWLYYLHSFVTAYLVSVCFAISLSIDIYLSIGTLEDLADASYFYMTQISFLIKFIIFTFKRNKFLRLLDKLEDPIFSSYRPKQKHYLAYWSKFSRMYSHFFYYCCFICSIFFAIFPYLDKDENNILPFRGWFPFDVKTNLVNRSIVYVFQILSLLIAISVNVSLDVLPSIFMNIACAQLEILKDNLENATSRAQKLIRRQNDETERAENIWVDEDRIGYYELFDKNVDQIVSNILRSCIQHHTFTIHFLKDVENMFTAGILVQFFDTVVTICITGLQLLVVSGKSLKYLTILIYFLAVACQISIYCWNGQQVTIQSSSIGDSCYNMDWYRCSSKVKRIIVIIIERCKKPIYLTAGTFFVLSVATLTGLLRTSYSYFAVLRQAYSD